MVLRHLFYSQPEVFTLLCEKLTKAVTDFLQLQIDAGADVIQICDSLGGVLAGNVFDQASGRWLRQIVASLKGQVPIIVFSKGAHGNLSALAGLGADVLGFDWTVSLAGLRTQLPETIGVQGNLDPVLLETTPEVIEKET